jgi:photosystem II stability/assembly factor-like uncharacterized protein
MKLYLRIQAIINPDPVNTRIPLLLIILTCLFVNAGRAQVNPNPDSTQPPPGSLLSMTWQKANTGTTEHLAAIAFTSRDTLYVGGATILKSIDGGSHWSPYVTSPSSGGPYFRSALEGAIVGPEHVVYFTNDGGQTWSASDDSLPYNGYAAFAGPHTFFINGGEFISRTTDAGKTWFRQTPKFANNLKAFAFADSLHGVVVGTSQSGPHLSQYSAACYTTSNGGTTWIQQYTGIDNDLEDITCFNADTFVAVGGGWGYLFRTTNGGQTWDSIAMGRPLANAISSYGASAVAVGSLGNTYFSTDYGRTWVSQPSGTTVRLYSVSMYDDTTAVAAGDGGVILRTTNGGASWVNDPKPLSLELILSPNPARNSIQVSYTLPTPQHVVLDVYSCSGQKQSGLSISNLQLGEQHLTIPTSSLESGVYYLELTSESFRQHASFTITR